MNQILVDRAAQLARLTMMIRLGLENAEAAIPGVNDQLDELAALGITNFQIEGPAVYCRPAGPSSDHDDSFVVYQAAIIQPGGIGCLHWTADEYDEHINPPYGDPVDLSPRFMPYDSCPLPVRALLVAHSGRLLDNLLADVRLLGS